MVTSPVTSPVSSASPGGCPGALAIARFVGIDRVLCCGFLRCRAEFWVLLVVEQGDVSKHLEFVHHVSPVDVQAVDVLHEPGDNLCHRHKFRAGKIVVLINCNAGYHREFSRSVWCCRARCSAACSQCSLAAAALSCAFVGAVVLWPREFTRSFGFWNSGVAKNGDGVRAVSYTHLTLPTKRIV